MCKLLSEWSPSEPAIGLIRLSGIDDVQITKSLNCLKDNTGLLNTGDVAGYDNWNMFFIMFCIKTSNSNGK